MTIKLPGRDYFSFQELMERWQCTENDLRSLVSSSELTPSIYVSGEVGILPKGGGEYRMMWAGLPGDQSRIELLDKINTSGWLYLKVPRLTGPFECQFIFATEQRRALQPNDPDFPLWTFWCCLPKAVTLTEVVIGGIFVAEEVARFEEKYRAQDGNPDALEKPLSIREHTTYLNIIGALMELIKSPKAGRSDDASVIKELVENYGDKYGISQSNLNRKIPEARRSLTAD